MICPDCGYELDLSQKHWDYLDENCYIIHSQLHHKMIFEQIATHYFNLPDNKEGWDQEKAWICIDECASEICGCSSCIIHNLRLKQNLDKLIEFKKISFNFTF